MTQDARNVSRIAICCLGAAVLIGALTIPPVEIRLNPRALIVGGALRVTCRVQPDEANRRLNFGIENYRDSEYMLEGRESKITFERLFEHVPCDTEKAYCQVIRADGKIVRVTEEFHVVGCDQYTR